MLCSVSEVAATNSSICFLNADGNRVWVKSSPVDREASRSAALPAQTSEGGNVSLLLEMVLSAITCVLRL